MKRLFWFAPMLGALMLWMGVPALAGEAGAAPGGGGRQGLKGALRDKVIQKFDKDGDGKLSPEERQAAREGLVDKLMQRFDKDGDGKLSREELSEALVAIRHRLGQAREQRAGGQGANARAGQRL